MNLLRCIAASAAFCTTSSVTPQSLMHEIVTKRKGVGFFPAPCFALQDGLEPTTPWLTVRCSNQLSYWSIERFLSRALTDFALQDGLEPTTPWLTVRCSNQLSYWSSFAILFKERFSKLRCKSSAEFWIVQLFWQKYCEKCAFKRFLSKYWGIISAISSILAV